MDSPSATPGPAVHLVREGWSGPIVVPVPVGKAVAFSARCPGKETDNEDGALVAPLAGNALLLAVADGCGGMPRGADASHDALAALLEAVRREAPSDGAATGLVGAVLRGFDAARDAILASGSGGATTLAAAVVAEGRLRPFHAGDSFILVTGQRGRIKYESAAHAPTAYAVAAGLMTEDEAMVDESRHIVSNIVGVPDMRVEVGPEIRLAVRDTVLLGSDGLSDNLLGAEICECVRAGPLEDNLIQLANMGERRMHGNGDAEFGHADDLTMVAFRLR